MKSSLRRNLVRLLKPRHVAFVGGRVAAAARRRCAQFGFAGDLWQVNPRGEGEESDVYASVSDLPEAPDAVFLAVSTDNTIDVVRSLADRGAGGCVCYAGGFAEKGGDGVALQNALVEAARDMALIGPNCFGLLDYRTGLHLWSGDVQRRFSGPGIAIVSQSGALAEFMTMARRSMPFVSIVSVGNQAILTLEHVVDTLLEDDDINAIGIYVEGLRDVPHFTRVAAKALRKQVPLVAIKVGRSDTGAEVARGHTSSLAGTGAIYDALFERLGVVQADSLSTFLETLKLLSVAGPLPGARIGAITESGGQAAMLADRALPLGLQLPPLTDRQVRTLREGLPDYVNPMNPLDMTIGPMGNREQLRLIFDVLCQGDIDVLTTALDAYESEDAPFANEVVMILEEFERALQRHGVIGIANSSLPDTLPEYVRKRAMAAGIAPIQGADEMLHAVAGAACYGRKLRELEKKDPDELTLNPTTLRTGNCTTLDEAQSKQFLADAGLRVPCAKITGADGVVEAAGEIGFPVVLKAVDADLLHKSESGAVTVDLQTEQALKSALERMQNRSPTQCNRYLVEEMVAGVVAELIVGIKYEPGFGHALVFGAGGVLVEFLRDSATLILPTGRDAIVNAFERLSVARLLAGFRGGPEGDLEATIDAIERIATLTMAAGDLVEVDINPLLVLAKGRGVVVADALVRRSLND